MSVIIDPERSFDITVPLLIIGAGACGLVAALAARDRGVEALVLERDAVPAGSTALSSGMIPACETVLQAAEGVADSVETMVADVMRKNAGEADAAVVEAVCRASGGVIDWLVATHGIELKLVDGFLYPGHSHRRMHAPPSMTGAALMGSLTRAAEDAGLDIVTNAHVTEVIADPEGHVLGVRFTRPDGTVEEIGCDALLLACNGFGGNRQMLKKYIPEMVDALYSGHVGNQGDAITWGRALGAHVADLGAYQGHGSVAHPHGMLISWALMMEGGFQVNQLGRRFSNEHAGYSEQAVSVLAQPDGIVWCVYDERLHRLGMGFEEYAEAQALGAVVQAGTVGELAERMDVPVDAFEETLAEIGAYCGGETDPFGRDFTGKPALSPPYHAIKVRGSLFHTQGGLEVDVRGQVLREDGSKLPNLYAAGGAARGLSGGHVWGYLSGNGLLSAVNMGWIAGNTAAEGALGKGSVF